MRGRIFGPRLMNNNVSSGVDISNVEDRLSDLIEENKATREMLVQLMDIVKNQSSVPIFSGTDIKKKEVDIPRIESSFFSPEVETLESNIDDKGKETKGKKMDEEELKKLKLFKRRTNG